MSVASALLYRWSCVPSFNSRLAAEGSPVWRSRSARQKPVEAPCTVLESCSTQPWHAPLQARRSFMRMMPKSPSKLFRTSLLSLASWSRHFPPIGVAKVLIVCGAALCAASRVRNAKSRCVCNRRKNFPRRRSLLCRAPEITHAYRRFSFGFSSSVIPSAPCERAAPMSGPKMQDDRRVPSLNQRVTLESSSTRLRAMRRGAKRFSPRVFEFSSTGARQRSRCPWYSNPASRPHIIDDPTHQRLWAPDCCRPSREPDAFALGAVRASAYQK